MQSPDSEMTVTAQPWFYQSVKSLIYSKSLSLLLMNKIWSGI